MTPFVQWSASHDLRHRPAAARPRARRARAALGGEQPVRGVRPVRSTPRWVLAVVPVVAAVVAAASAGLPG